MGCLEGSGIKIEKPWLDNTLLGIEAITVIDHEKASSSMTRIDQVPQVVS